MACSESLLQASKKIATPVMTLPVRADAGKDAAHIVASHLGRVRLAEILKSVQVVETPLTAHPRSPDSRKVRLWPRPAYGRWSIELLIRSCLVEACCVVMGLVIK